MNEEQLAFIEDLGVVFEEAGAAPMLGRVYGALLVSCETEMTAENLATALHASRGAISQATRQLVDMGLLRRTHKPGERKDFFQLTSEGWVHLSRFRFEKSTAMADLFRRGLETIPDASPQARAALLENLEFLDYWKSIVEDFFEGWEQHKENTRAKRHTDN